MEVVHGLNVLFHSFKARRRIVREEDHSVVYFSPLFETRDNAFLK
jgi:hypothetical protein